MSDYLKPLPVKEVAAWYYRLAGSISKKKIQGAEPLASVFLKHWLENRKKGSVFKFDAPLYLKKNKRVREVQQYHRNVFLTKKKARVGKSEKWAGVVPRFQGIGYSKCRVGSPMPMHYQSLCDIAPSLVDLIMIQRNGTDAERDLMTSLRGFQLHSEVNLFGNLQASGLVKIRFASWRCKVLDTYDWNYNEYFTVPNPDFGSGASNAIQPKEQSLRVYHLNAKRLEDAALALPFTHKYALTVIRNPKA